MIVLVTGGSGRLGSNLIKLFLENKHKVYYTFNTYQCSIAGSVGYRVDITKKHEISELVDRLKPDLVIHTSAITDLELCESNREIAYEVNVEGTRNVVESCEKNNSRIAYASTSNVFSGDKDVYYENDAPVPPNYYAITKLLGEEIVNESNVPFLILRTDQLYCWTTREDKKTFVERVLEKLAENRSAEAFIDWYNTPTYIPNFCFVTLELIRSNKCGVYHIVGPDYVNRFEWALEIAKAFGYDEDLVKPILSTKASMKAKRGNVHLSNVKVTSELGAKLLGVKEGLVLMKREMLKNIIE